MRLPRPSLHILTLTLLVFLSMALLLSSSEIYRRLAYDHQIEALASLIKLETADALQDLEIQMQEVGIAIQHEPLFREMFNRKDASFLEFELDNQFHQHAVTGGTINLVRLYVYDLDFTLIAQSTAAPSSEDAHDVICPSLRETARKREGVARLQSIAELCTRNNQPYFSVMVPIGGLRPTGYIQVVVDPAQSLGSMEERLKIPVRVTLGNGSETYKSLTWQDNGDVKKSLVSDYVLLTPRGRPALKISAMRNISKFSDELDYTRNLVIGIGGGITLLAALLASLMLQKTTLEPIRLLTRQLQTILQNKNYPKESIMIQGEGEVHGLAQVFNEMSGDLNSLYNTMEKMAFIDTLTQLPNRTFLQQRLEEAIAINSHNNGCFGLILLDLDGFKEINDTLGHPVGDLLLKQVGERLKKTLESFGSLCDLDTHTVEPAIRDVTLARLGGDEFAILMPMLTSAHEAIGVAHEITEVLQAPFSVDGTVVAIGGSIGITLFPEHGADSDTLLRRADVALYIAKHTRNAYAVYDPAHDQNSVGQLSLRAELRSAIDQGDLCLYYQPKLHIKTGHIIGVEAVVRWLHPQRGLLSPDKFLPLAERGGLMGALTQWVIGQALRQHLDWRREGLDLKVAVNVSARVLYDLRLPEQIAHQLKILNVPPSALELEITEDAIMIDPQRALDILSRLDAMRIKLSIDDFGTGYSSLGYLKRLPVDEVKIDRSFVKEMVGSRSDAAIVRATIDLAHNLGINVVAEGVETAEVLAMLDSLGCDTAQGYYISRPITADEILAWMSCSPFARQDFRDLRTATPLT